MAADVSAANVCAAGFKSEVQNPIFWPLRVELLLVSSRLNIFWVDC